LAGSGDIALGIKQLLRAPHVDREGGRVGIRFVVIEPALFEELQHWNQPQDEGRGLGLSCLSGPAFSRRLP